MCTDASMVWYMCIYIKVNLHYIFSEQHVNLSVPGKARYCLNIFNIKYFANNTKYYYFYYSNILYFFFTESFWLNKKKMFSGEFFNFFVFPQDKECYFKFIWKNLQKSLCNTFDFNLSTKWRRENISHDIHKLKCLTWFPLNQTPSDQWSV